MKRNKEDLLKEYNKVLLDCKRHMMIVEWMLLGYEPKKKTIKSLRFEDWRLKKEPWPADTISAFQSSWKFLIRHC